MEAVVSGDIVDSSKLSTKDRKKLEQFLWEEATRLNINDSEFSVQRGDSFQFITPARDAFEKSIRFRCALKNLFTEHAADARIAIGLGEITVKGKTVASSDGTAFQRSGKTLDTLKDLGVNLAVSCGIDIWDMAWQSIAGLADEHISAWSNKQAEAILGRLDNLTYEQMSEKFKVNSSAVHKRVQSAHWKSVQQALEFYVNWVTHLEQAK